MGAFEPIWPVAATCPVGCIARQRTSSACLLKKVCLRVAEFMTTPTAKRKHEIAPRVVADVASCVVRAVAVDELELERVLGALERVAGVVVRERRGLVDVLRAWQHRPPCRPPRGRGSGGRGWCRARVSPGRGAGGGTPARGCPRRGPSRTPRPPQAQSGRPHPRGPPRR